MSNTTISFTKQIIGELDSSVHGVDMNTVAAHASRQLLLI
jgi:hypothetical protein